MDQSDLLFAVRRQISDVEKSFLQTIQATGGTNRYQLEYAPVRADSVQVHLDGVQITDKVAVEEQTGVLIFDDDVVPQRNQNIAVAGMSTRYFTDSELGKICQDSFEMHANNRADARGRALTLANIQPVEDLPIQILAAIQALYVLLTDSAYDIDINAPDGVMIPRSQRYRQLYELLQALEARYRDLSANLNVGLYAMEVFTLRRISQRTGRYVPIWVPREFDDYAPPVRVRLPIPTYGGAPKPDNGVQVYDLAIAQGSTYVRTFDFSVGEDGLPFDLTGYTAKAQIRRTALDSASQATFTSDPEAGLYIDALAGLITLIITGPQTEKLYHDGVWDMEITKDDVVTRVLEGRVFVDYQVTR
jgi:hypothetical protein